MSSTCCESSCCRAASSAPASSSPRNTCGTSRLNATDYREPLLTWFVHKVPNVTPAELSALGLAAVRGEMAERVKSLGNHQCLYKSFDVPGEIIRGLPFFELVQRAAGER